MSETSSDKRLRLVFMGTAELARECLRALADAGRFDLAAVVTQPDRPSGRKLKLQPSPVKALAVELGLPVLQPDRARDESFIAELRALAPELIAVAAYGQILPKAILDLPPHGCLNVHASLLPAYRGASPIQAAILNDDAESGVTIMRMDEGLDTGDIVSLETTPIDSKDDAQSLHDRLARIGGDLLVRTIPEYTAGRMPPRPQPEEGVSHVGKIRKQEGEIDWTQPARAIWCRARAFTPWPGAFVWRGEGEGRRMLKLWKTGVMDAGGLEGRPGEILQADKNGVVIACGELALRVEVLQPEGKRRMSAQEFLTGHELQPGRLITD